MKNELLTKGIILPSGEIGKNKINLVAGAITQPFAAKTFAQLTQEEKAEISHRGKALREFTAKLETYLKK